jgi:asparagine synthase (glutamine-hydrolysing)
LFSPAAINAVIQRHFSRKENLGYHIWGLLTLHLWMRRWKIEGEMTANSIDRAALVSAGG